MIELPIKPNENSLRLLLRARLMLAHAQEHSSQKIEFDNMIAVLGLDNTVEYILRCISSHLDLESITGHSFDIVDLSSLAASINKALMEHANIKLPYLGEIKLLRQTRNLVQHGAVAPYADLERFSVIVERFFGKILESIFGIPLERLKISSCINNTYVQSCLKKSESSIEKKEWLDAVISSRDAFENECFNRVKNSDIAIPLYPLLVKEKSSGDFSLYAFETIKNELEMSFLGINNPDYRHLKEYFEHIPLEHCPKDSRGSIVMQRPWNKDDAIFCYNYVANTIIKWQERDKERLYKINFDSITRSTKEIIDGIEISDNVEHGCYYIFDNGNRLQLFYTGEETKKLFENLVDGYDYKSESIVYEKEEIISEHKGMITLLGKYSYLVTNSPERWAVVIWFKEKK